MAKKEDHPTGALLTAKSWIWTLSLALGGLAFLYVSELLREHFGQVLLQRLSETVGATLFAGAAVALAIEVILRRYRDDSLRKLVEDSIEAKVPENYKNIREHGVKDCYHQLDILQLQRKLGDTHTGTIRISVIWIPQLELLRPALLHAVKTHGTPIHVLIADPAAVEPLRKRAAAVPGYTARMYREFIELNLRIFAAMSAELTAENKEWANKLIVRKYDGFIASALYGYGENFLVGLYLSGRLSTSGLQFRVSDNDTTFYRQLHDHFETCWRASEAGEIRDWTPYLQQTDELFE